MPELTRKQKLLVRMEVKRPSGQSDERNKADCEVFAALGADEIVRLRPSASNCDEPYEYALRFGTEWVSGLTHLTVMVPSRYGQIVVFPGRRFQSLAVLIAVLKRESACREYPPIAADAFEVAE